MTHYRYLTDLRDAEHDGSIVTAVGTDTDTGERVRFAGDWRMLQAAMQHPFSTFIVEPWQVLAVHGDKTVVRRREA